MARRDRSFPHLYVASALALAISIGSAPFPATGASTGGSHHSALGTPEQLRAEKLVLALLDDPAIAAAEAQLRSELENDPAATDASRRLLEAAVGEWTRALMMREQAADLANPQILWEFDDTPHSWFGLDFPGASGFGDDPNHIYRVAFVEGSGQYEITGRIPDIRPAMFSFEAVLGNPGMKLEQRLNAGAVDVGNQVALLTDRNIRTTKDGTFRITIGAMRGRPIISRQPPGWWRSSSGMCSATGISSPSP